MNEFRTIINPGNAGFKADLATPVMAIGSCFASHMAARLDKHGLPVSAHPFGIVYHPLAIGRQLQLLNKKSSFDPARIVKDNDHFKHLDAHGSAHAALEPKNRKNRQTTLMHHNFLSSPSGQPSPTIGNRIKKSSPIVTNKQQQTLHGRSIKPMTWLLP